MSGRKGAMLMEVVVSDVLMTQNQLQTPRDPLCKCYTLFNEDSPVGFCFLYFCVN